MTESEQSPALQDNLKIPRNPDGTFPKGVSGNPKGGAVGSQFNAKMFHDIAVHYLTNYSIEELRELSKNQEKLGKLKVVDGIVLARIFNAIGRGAIGSNDFDRILDRVIGKVASTVQHANADGSNIEIIKKPEDLVLFSDLVNRVAADKSTHATATEEEDETE